MPGSFYSYPNSMPESVSLADSSVIKGTKRLELESGALPSDSVWDEVVLLAPSETTAATEFADAQTIPTDTKTPTTEESREDPPKKTPDGLSPLIVTIIAVAAIIVIASICLVKRKNEK